MRNFIHTAIRTLLAAAHRRATNVMHKQAESGRSGPVEYRSNAGGWN